MCCRSHTTHLTTRNSTMELGAAILFSVALANLCAASPVKSENYFDQKLDHFDPDNKEYFKQKYYKYDDYYREGAPIFLEIGGEFEAFGSGVWFVNDMVKENYGAIFALEHRYYRESVPESFSGGIPRYLSTEQALADIAYFIEAQKELYPNSSWIVHGCSYAGQLAAWARLKYPHLVQGAIAGSAPVLAKADNYEYFEVVGEVIKKRAPLCHQKIVEATEELATLEETIDGQKKLARIFRVPSYSPEHGNGFRYSLSAVAGGGIQYLTYHQPYVSTMCDLVTKSTNGTSTLEILTNFMMSIKKTRSLELKTRSDTVIGFRQLPAKSAYMYFYQECHEFGLFKTLSSKKQPFGVWRNVNEVFTHTCGQWNTTLETLEDNIRKTNLRYGGRTPNVTNVVFMHGSNDPWYPLGVLSDLSSSARSFIFQELSHCEGFIGRAAAEGHPEWTKMYEEIESIVRSWF